jgi:hypothetical protein
MAAVQSNYQQYFPSFGVVGHDIPIQNLSLDQHQHQVIQGFVDHAQPYAVEHAHAFVDPLEEKFQKLQKSLSQALEIYQEQKGQFPARSIILKSPKTKVERVPVSQGPGYPMSYIAQTVPVTKEVRKSTPQVVQKPDGTFETRSVTMTTLEQDFEETKVHIQRIPKGCDLTEYCSPEDSELSHQLLQAIKSAADSPGGASLDKALKDAFATATTAVWGPYPESLAATIVPVTAFVAPKKAATFTIAEKK